MAASANPSRMVTLPVAGLLFLCTALYAQIAIPATRAASRSGSSMAIPIGLSLGVLAVAAVILAIWRRDGRLRAQREVLRRAYELGEEVLGCASADQILHRVRLVVPKIFGVSNAGLYLYNPHTKTLDAVDRNGAEPVSIPLGTPPAGPQAGAVACFHYRTLLAIPDTSRSPFPVNGSSGDVPRSLLFVPMLVQGEVVGILEMDRRDRARDFSRDEQALAQHLANQIGVAVKLLDQRSVREQLFRTEKLAAVGQLISGIVNELQTPLAAIGNLAQGAGTGWETVPEQALNAIAAEARRASDIVTRLVGFAGVGQAPSQTVEISDLLRNLIEFRDREWKVRGIRVHTLLGEEPMKVLGSHGQLEQVFLNLLVHAEQALSDATEKIITIRTSQIARRILIEIGYSGPKTGVDPFSSASDEAAGASGLGVCRSLITGHGGEIRLVQPAAAEPAFQIELPITVREKVAGAVAENGRNGSHVLTALLIEPAEAAGAQLQSLLAARSYRVVPIPSSDEGLDLAQRLRFDAVFCSVHAPGLNWVETAEQLRNRVGGFVLLSDSYDADLAANFESENRFVLPKPLDEKQLDRILAAMQGGSRGHGTTAR
jgi:GAF domain-containing protein/CheY-like chemotaxis protein